MTSLLSDHSPFVQRPRLLRHLSWRIRVGCLRPGHRGHVLGLLRVLPMLQRKAGHSGSAAASSWTASGSGGQGPDCCEGAVIVKSPLSGGWEQSCLRKREGIEGKSAVVSFCRLSEIECLGLFRPSQPFMSLADAAPCGIWFHRTPSREQPWKGVLLFAPRVASRSQKRAWTLHFDHHR